MFGLKKKGRAIGGVTGLPDWLICGPSPVRYRHWSVRWVTLPWRWPRSKYGPLRYAAGIHDLAYEEGGTEKDRLKADMRLIHATATWAFHSQETAKTFGAFLDRFGHKHFNYKEKPSAKDQAEGVVTRKCYLAWLRRPAHDHMQRREVPHPRFGKETWNRDSDGQ